MGILEIVPVTRAGMRLLISLYGLSETGKTLSALRLAAGIEPDPRKRALLDTEGGQRGRAYGDHIEGGYMYAALTPPFTPERYIEAVQEIERAGVNVLVIDSVSHSWAAEGGILDMVEVANEKNDLAKWAKPKRRLGKMTRRLLSSDMHIILCARAKQPLVEEIVDGKKRYVQGPVIPVQEKTLRYDMTIMAQMTGDGHFTIKAPAGKCPGVLRPIFEASPQMTEETGRRLVQWLGATNTKSADLRGLETAGAASAERGTAAFTEWWNSEEVKPRRAALRANLGNYQSVAKAADDEAERQARDGRDHEGLEDPFSGAAPSPALVSAPLIHAVGTAFVLVSGEGEELIFEDATDLPRSYREELTPIVEAKNFAAVANFDNANRGLFQALCVSHPQIAAEISRIDAEVRMAKSRVA